VDIGRDKWLKKLKLSDEVAGTMEWMQEQEHCISGHLGPLWCRKIMCLQSEKSRQGKDICFVELKVS